LTGLKRGLKGVLNLPDGDFLEVQLVRVPGLQAIDAQVLSGDLVKALLVGCLCVHVGFLSMATSTALPAPQSKSFLHVRVGWSGMRELANLRNFASWSSSLEIRDQQLAFG
jgi:hypothetical protein